MVVQVGDFDKEFRGLTGEPIQSWPKVEVGDGDEAIDVLKPGSDLHKRVLQYLLDRLDESEGYMTRFHARWRANEMKLQAYISLPKWEQSLKEMNNSGEPPKVVSVVIPYSMAIISTIVTYLLHTFAGRRPLMPVGTYKDETVQPARSMETVLQYNADHTRLVRQWFHHFQDAEIYGVAAIRSLWETKYEMRTRRRLMKKFSLFGRGKGNHISTTRDLELVYEGNRAISQDPFMFFPDPRVPMEEVNERGEYCWWRSFEGRHNLLNDDNFKHVKAISGKLPETRSTAGAQSSARGLLSGGDPQPGSPVGAGVHRGGAGKGASFVQVDQGTVWVIPKELGIGHGEKPELWIFAIGNKSQIIQAEPFDTDHGQHPVGVTEPYSLGYGFGHPGMMDYLGPLQDTISWLVNSHIDNVRKVLNDVMVYDPSAVEEQDLKNPSPGKLIRLKRAAIGRDVRTVLQQLVVQDVTRGHIEDAQLFMRLGQLLSSVQENLQGVQQQGGRKTATEVRMAGESAVSRLASHARLISSQSLVDMTRQWSLNIQQHISDEFFLQVTGSEGEENPIHITPDQLTGDFHYPVHDGVLPPDKVAAFDIWKDVFGLVLQDEQLRSEYSAPKIFEFLAELGGAQNIEAMRIGAVGAAPDEALAAEAAAGNVVPIGQAGNLPGGPSGLVNALGGASPGNRAQGSLTS